jgi:CRISPR/Cas system CSM-associated protein Csm3 (group 7 of RAMP superfamily)
MNVIVEFTWTTKTPLRVHTGLARSGGVDRAVRERNDSPVLPGEAVKAAIREAAERILRWQGKYKMKEEEARSIPMHPLLLRIFAPHSASSDGAMSSARYFFRSSIATKESIIDKMEVTSTAINEETGTSKDNMLRSIEIWRPGIQFDLEIEGVNGDWSVGRLDHKDLCLLLMAIAATDAIGGGWGIGCGELALSDLKYRVELASGGSYTSVETSDLGSLQRAIEAIESDVAPEELA